jgi:hypothetical protein
MGIMEEVESVPFKINKGDFNMFHKLNLDKYHNQKWRRFLIYLDTVNVIQICGR